MRLSQLVPKTSENHMKTQALGFLLMVAAAGVYAVGCGSSNNNNNGTGGAAGAGTGGRGGAAGAGQGGAGQGGAAGAGTGGKMDGGPDAPKDTPSDTPSDTPVAPTFTDVYAILSNITTPTADTAPGCLHCHDGVTADGGAATTLPHSMDFSTKTAAFNALVGINSLRCPGADGGAGLKRVLASNAAQSVLWQKLNQGVNGPSMPACDNVGMPINRLVPADGGGADAGDGGSVDAGFVQATHYGITSAQLQMVMDWINAGAQNN
jgi:hypothetical protein